MGEITPDFLLYGFIWYIAFLFSTTCHEAAHALVAKRGGDETAAQGGQVSLNPIPHMQREPFGMILIPLLSYFINHSMIGWASAPFDPAWERRHPKRAGWMALAGPAANFTLMILAVIGLRVGSHFEWFGRDARTGRPDFAFVTLIVFFSLNLLLGTFNLLPVPPLDGSTGILVLMSDEQAQKYLGWLRGNSYAMLGLLVALVVFSRIYPHIQAFATSILFGGHF
jgi:Zn-dependent protease